MYATCGSGRPIVFQHGLGGDATQPADVFPVSSGWAALTLECRGHGQSEAGSPQAFSIATFAADVIATIEAAGGGPMPVGGISMGAAIALRIAALRPDLVSALVLARPAWLDANGPENMQPNMFVGELLRDFAPDDAAKLLEKSSLADRLASEAPDNLVALRGFSAGNQSRSPGNYSSASPLMVPVSTGKPSLPCTPRASHRQRRRSVHPIGMARELATLLPNARFVEITSKSVDRNRYREEFCAALAAFLKELTP